MIKDLLRVVKDKSLAVEARAEALKILALIEYQKMCSLN